MKKNEIKIGGTYTAKVSNNLVPVKIVSAAVKGWHGVNVTTGRAVRVLSAARLRKVDTRFPQPT